jgi:carbonic anhydrase
MTTFSSVVKIGLLIVFAEGSRAAGWKYHNASQGSNYSWHHNFPLCGGNRQSPINIIHNSTAYDSSLKSLSFSGYSETQNGMMVNTGHTLQYNPDKTKTLTISDGPLNSTTYVLAQFHFHFGSHDLAGSEHTLMGIQKSAEVHFVHYNSDKYSSIDKAVNESDGLAVIGVFLEIGAANSQIDRLHIDKLLYQDNKTDVSQLNLLDLLPTSREYYTYIGSLTTPPCYESVLWIVMKNPITLSKEQMEHFRSSVKIAHEEGHKQHDDIADNYREVQPLNGRIVKRNFNDEMISTPEPSSKGPTPSEGVPLMSSKVVTLFMLVFMKVF